MLARNVAAGAITASKLSIGSVAGGNLALNGDMEETLVSGGTTRPAAWDFEGSAGTNWYTEQTGGVGSGKGVTLDRGTADGTTSLNYAILRSLATIPVVAGQSYELSCYLRGGAPSSGGTFLRAVWYTAAGANVNYSDAVSNGAITTTLTRRAGTVTAPAGAALAKIEVYNWQSSITRYLTIDQVVLRPTVGVTTIEDGAITTSKLVANSVVASKLAIGSVNQFYNADHAQGLLGFGVTYNDTGLTPTGLYFNGFWAPAGETSLSLQIDGTPASGKAYQVTSIPVNSGGGLNSNYSVRGNYWYEFSAGVSLQKCNAQVCIDWFDSNNAYISTVYGNVLSENNANGGSINGFPRSWVIAQAPSNAAYARLNYRMVTTGATNPYSWWTCPMFAPCIANQAEPSPYTEPAVTSITGGNIITRTLAASKIVASSITTGELNVGDIFANSAVINQLTTSLLTADKITATMLSANAVQARNVAAGAITASKLTLSDPSNMILNGDLLNEGESWAIQANVVIDHPGSSDAGGANRFYTSTPSVYTAAISPWIQTTPGDVVTVSCMVYNNRNTGSAGFYIQCANQDESTVTSDFPPGGYTASKNSWNRVTAQYTIPSGRQKFRVVPYADTASTGSTFWGKFSARRASDTLLIVDGAITAQKINAASVFGDQGVFNSLKAGIASFGGLTADQLAAGAVTAGKIGVGLSTGNLIWNSDFQIMGWVAWATNTTGGDAGGFDTYWSVNGTNAYRVSHPGSPPSGQYSFFDIQQPKADGNATSYFQVQAGKTYELSAYLSVHRCTGRLELHWLDGNNTEIGVVYSNNLGDGGGARLVPTDSWRAKLQGIAPSNAVYAYIRTVAVFNGQAQPYLFGSAYYFGLVPTGATGFSEYAIQSRTIIDGGSVALNTLNANRIVAGSITSDKFTGNTIDTGILTTGSLYTRVLQSAVLIADNITVGNGSITSLINGSNTTKINGGAIQANTITANLLKVGSRNIQLVGVSFYMERDGNGNITNVFRWTGGHVLVTDNNGFPQAYQIPAGAQTINGGYWYVWWNIITPGQLYMAQDNWDAILADPNTVLMAAVSGLTGISVLVGGTIIDGTRITTLSIQADQIAANAIQASKIAANAVQANHITANSISTDKIIANNVSQVSSQYSTTSAAYAGLTLRAGSQITIICGRNGNPGNAIAPPGAPPESNLHIEVSFNGGNNWQELYATPACTSYQTTNGVVAGHMQPCYIGYALANSWGAVACVFRVRDDNQRLGTATFISVTELAR